jgi:hypothetical protein
MNFKERFISFFAELVKMTIFAVALQVLSKTNNSRAHSSVG